MVVVDADAVETGQAAGAVGCVALERRYRRLAGASIIDAVAVTAAIEVAAVVDTG